MDLKTFRTDEQHEIDGVWQALGDGASVLLARIGNKKYLKKLKQAYKPHRRAMQRDTINDDLLNSLMIGVLADTIVLDWKGLKEDDREVPYSRENCVRLLTEYKDFREVLIEMASDLESYHVAEVEKKVKK